MGADLPPGDRVFKEQQRQAEEERQKNEMA
jgi:hypothetical protein